MEYEKHQRMEYLSEGAFVMSVWDLGFGIGY